MSKYWTDIERKIYEENSYLLNIEPGQRFMSDYYGVIIATQIDFHSISNTTPYSVYGFDIKTGLPRSNYDRDLELLGKEIKLDDVLFWLSYKDQFSVTMKKGSVYIFGYAWDFSKGISNQNKELINYLIKL